MATGDGDGGRAPRIERMRRLRLLRDVAVFQLKLFVDAAKDLFLSPLSLAAALADLLRPGPRDRMLFYRLLAAGRDVERRINLFGTRPPPGDPWTMDEVVKTVEGRVREGARAGGRRAPEDEQPKDEGDEHA